MCASACLALAVPRRCFLCCFALATPLSATAHGSLCQRCTRAMLQDESFRSATRLPQSSSVARGWAPQLCHEAIKVEGGSVTAVRKTSAYTVCAVDQQVWLCMWYCCFTAALHIVPYCDTCHCETKGVSKVARCAGVSNVGLAQGVACVSSLTGANMQACRLHNGSTPPHECHPTP